MYKLMLVEDEALVRESMIQNIDWASYGFQLVSACENGQEALEQLPSVLPDVVITDICMPLVDGLELTRHLREHYPSVFVVILTGFNEFSYAQQAVKLRVNDFVLKPVAPKDFYAILTKLSHELSERDSRRNNIRNLQTRVNQAETTLRNTLFRHILRNAISSEELQQAAVKAGMKLDCPVYCALFCQPGSSVQGVTAVQHMQDVALETASRFPRCVSAVVDDHYAVLLLGGKTKDEMSQRAKDAGAMLALSISRAFGTPAQVGIGTCCSSLSGLHRCFKEAYHALGYGFTSGSQVIVDHLALAAERPPTPEHPLPGEREILRALQAHDESGARTLVEQLFSSFARRGMHLNACVPILERLRFALMDLIPADKLRAAPQIPPVAEWFRAEEIQQAYLQLVSFVYRLSVQDTEDPALRCVENAKGYIQQHFHDSEFSLTELLSLLNVSKSYFSTVFKAQTGQTFVEYLTSVRMAKAKQLLLGTSLCTYEIAERIGFTDPHYFSVTFKRYVGKTPKEYREEGSQ